MAKKLKVTWQDGNWNRDGQQPIATVELPMGASVASVGDDTLVFKAPGSAQTLLVVPGQRLISAVEIEGEAVNG